MIQGGLVEKHTVERDKWKGNECRRGREWEREMKSPEGKRCQVLRDKESFISCPDRTSGRPYCRASLFIRRLHLLTPFHPCSDFSSLFLLVIVDCSPSFSDAFLAIEERRTIRRKEERWERGAKKERSNEERWSEGLVWLLHGQAA